MSHSRRHVLKTLAALPLAATLPALAQQKPKGLGRDGLLRVAVYDDFAPYSDAGRGVDVDIAKALAAKLGLTAQIVGFKAGDDMDDDLRNMVWKGHYLRGQPADVMMRVPVAEALAQANDKVRIFGAYQHESIAMARVPSRVPAPDGSSALALEVFTREKIGVEGETLADLFLLGTLNGRLRENVAHYRSVTEAVQALRDGAVSAVMATRGQLENALAGETRFAIDDAKIFELKNSRWPVGMAVESHAVELAEALTQALADLKQDGTLASIFKRYHLTAQEA